MNIKQKLRNLLTEKSFNEFNVDDILTDKYVKNHIESGESDILIHWYQQQYDMEDVDEDEITSSEEYFNFIKDELENHLYTAMDNIYDKIDYHSDKIRLYRAMTVDDNWLNHLKKEGKRLGIFWSYESSGAETHWGDNSKNNTAIIEIEIDEKYVNWVETLQLNSHPNYHEEQEIRLFKNTPIKIERIIINDEEVDISEIQDKIFYA